MRASCRTITASEEAMGQGSNPALGYARSGTEKGTRGALRFSSGASGGSDVRTGPRHVPQTIERLADAVYPSFAMLAGLELDLFTPMKDGPLTAEEIAEAAATNRAKTAPLLHALVAVGLLKF